MIDAPGILPEAETTIPARFAQMAALHSSRIALGGSAWRPTYAELDAASNHLAKEILARGGNLGDRIAILMRHDAPLIAAALSALKTGRVVLVLNPTDPAGRLNEILNDGEPHLILTDNANARLARELAAEHRAIIEINSQQSESTPPPPLTIAPGSPAWLLYTSGTTGRPKGVIQTHRNIVHNVLRLCRGMNMSASDRVVLLNSPAGGQGLSTTWCPLLSGAGLFPFPAADRGVTGLKEWMISSGITIYVSSASLFRSFARTLGAGDVLPEIKLVRLGSEAVTADDFHACQRIFTGKFVLLNSLSTSETGNIAQRRFPHDSQVSDGRLSVGWPAQGIDILLVNDMGGEIQDDAVGEIVVRSNYLSPGYWRNEKLTAARFSESKSGLREFRGGDRARRAPNGELIFMGRGDAQVKIHGYRVEPQEIEAALLQQEEVESATVSARRNANEEVELAAHVVLRAGRTGTPEMLRRALRKTLPGYMVPARFAILDKLPLTAHGKIDHEKLRQPDPLLTTRQSQAGATPTEALLAEICGKVFDRAVSADDDFFDLGGDSLKAAIIAAEIHAALKVELELRTFNEHPKLSDLATTIDKLQSSRESSDATPSIPRAPRDQPPPLSFRQEDIWTYSQTPDGMAAYAMSSTHVIRGPLNVERLRKSMTRLAFQHEILRTTFDQINGQLSQIIHPPSEVELPVIDCQQYPDPKARAAEIVRAEGARLFDLKKLPLVRFFVARLGVNEHWLVRFSHHILFDAWSWAVYFRELGVIYEEFAERTSPLRATSEPVQYADYAVQQRRQFDSSTAAYQKELEWWLRLHSAPAPPVRLPFRRLWRAQNARPDDGILFWGIPSETSQALENIARAENATFYVVRLAALLALLSEDAPQRDVVIGAYVTGRNRLELQNMLGDFSNTVALRMRYEPRQTFREWMGKVREHVADAQERAEIPHERLRAEMSKRGVRPPDVRVVFNVWEHTMPVRFAGIEMRLQGRHVEGMPWGFCLTCDRYNESNGSRASFDARIYNPARVQKWLRRFTRILEKTSENPDLPIAKILAASKSLRF
jgi:amino acid adenylation domain-containing protein